MSIPIVQEYDIRSVGSLEPWLKLIVTDGRISHYYVDPTNGVETLNLLWAPPSTTAAWRTYPAFLGTYREEQASGGSGRWIGPDVATLASNISAWLETTTYPEPDRVFDGSRHRGWRLTNKNCHGLHEFFVEPWWQEIGK